MLDFWIPKFKWQYVEWFKRHRPDWKISRWNLDQMKAIYINTRLKNG